MENYEYNEANPQLRKTGTLTAGLVLSIVSIVAYLLYLVFCIISTEWENNYMINTIISVIITALCIGVLVAFIPYLGNFNMQSAKALIFCMIGIHAVSALMSVIFFFIHTAAMNSGNVSLSGIYGMINAVYLVFYIVYWAAAITLGAVLISNKSDFVGGIRAIGITYILLAVCSVFVYFLRMFGYSLMPDLLSSPATMKVYNIILTSVSIISNIIVLAVYLYVFARASQYATSRMR